VPFGSFIFQRAFSCVNSLKCGLSPSFYVNTIYVFIGETVITVVGGASL